MDPVLEVGNNFELVSWELNHLSVWDPSMSILKRGLTFGIENFSILLTSVGESYTKNNDLYILGEGEENFRGKRRFRCQKQPLKISPRTLCFIFCGTF